MLNQSYLKCGAWRTACLSSSCRLSLCQSFSCAACRPGTDHPLSRRRVGILQIYIIISSSSCSSGCPSCSFPLTSMAVTVRGSSVVGLVLFGFPTLSPDRSVRCKRSVEVAGWKYRQQQTSHSQRFLFYFVSFLDGICDRLLVLPFAFTRALPLHLLVTSKITTRKTYVKDWMTFTHERTLTERHRVQHKHNVQMQTITIYFINPSVKLKLSYDGTTKNISQ